MTQFRRFPWTARMAMAVALSGFSGGASASGGDPDAGMDLAGTLCATCHAIGREGDSAFEAAPPFRDIARQSPPEFLEEALAEGIVVGHPAMPEFTLSPEQIGDITTYLDTLIEE